MQDFTSIPGKRIRFSKSWQIEKEKKRQGKEKATRKKRKGKEEQKTGTVGTSTTKEKEKGKVSFFYPFWSLFWRVYPFFVPLSRA